MKMGHRNHVDLKTLTIGILLGVCVMLARGQSGLDSGRYQITAIERTGDDGKTPQTVIFALDRQTNKVWGYVRDDSGWHHPTQHSVQLQEEVDKKRQ